MMDKNKQWTCTEYSSEYKIKYYIFKTAIKKENILVICVILEKRILSNILVLFQV